MAHAVVERGPAVDADAELEPHIGAAGPHALQEAAVQGLGLVREEPGVGLDSRLAEHRDALPRDLGVRIDHRGDNAGDTGLNEGLGAGRSPSVVGAWLEGYIGGGALRLLPGLTERVNLGMGLTGLPVIALSDDLAVLHDDRADRRVGRHRVKAALREAECLAHIMLILASERHLYCSVLAQYFLPGPLARAFMQFPL